MRRQAEIFPRKKMMRWGKLVKIPKCESPLCSRRTSALGKTSGETREHGVDDCDSKKHFEQFSCWKMEMIPIFELIFA